MKDSFMIQEVDCRTFGVKLIIGLNIITGT